MIYLNLGCGYPRPQNPPWINIDQLHAALPDPKCPSRVNLAKESNYRDCDLSKGIPFYDGEVDAILASHFFEHLDPREGLAMMKECLRVLKPGGVLRTSVPDCEKMIVNDKNGVVYPDERAPEGLSMAEFVLMFPEHKQLSCYGTMFALYYLSGFKDITKREYAHSPVEHLAILDNRPAFSLFMEGTK